MKVLTVIVLGWNGLQLTRETLDSLRACRVPEGWRAHVMVVDNASTDGSPAAIAADYPWVELLALNENRRFAGGNNVGITHALDAGADAVMLLNNDVVADPGLYEKLLAALAENPRAGAAAPLIYHAAPSSLIWYAGGRCEPWWAHTSHRGIRETDSGQYRSIERTGYLTGCCLLATAECWRKVGLLDEAYFIYAEDADWSLRARAAGFELLFVPTARLWHQVSASSGGAASPWKLYQRTRANARLFARHARALAAFTAGPAFLAQSLALLSLMALRGNLAAAGAVARALVDSVTNRNPAEVKL
ncbi:MAG: glycosyltransferase family 2 protein [Candidatus Eisenbacteria bacterium]|nr:glycosyltransferase family 2 protein [Candidatus Eisenbacteria bacterium]